MGFEDKTRGTLFFDIIKIIEVKKPRYILLENVKHLSSHDDGNTWMTIKESLRELGYFVPDEPVLLSPHELGVPQIRWRVFIPAVRNDSNISNSDLQFDFDNLKSNKINKFVFDKNVPEKVILKDGKILNTINAWGEFIKKVKRPPTRTLPVIWLDYMDSRSIDEIDDFKTFPSWKQKYIKDMKKIYSSNKAFIDEWKLRNNVEQWQKRERKLEWQAGSENYNYKNSYIQLRQSGFRFKRKGIFPTLVAMVQTSIIFDKKIDSWRYLTKNEVRKLQSFPRSFKYNVKDYQTYKQFGNSVNVRVVEIVLSKLLAIKW